MRFNTIALSAILLSCLTACGGDGNNDSNQQNSANESDTSSTTSPTTPPSTTPQTGVLLDTVVQGVSVYQDDIPIGRTNEKGEFSYTPNKMVTFKINNLVLGSAMPKPIVTPQDFSKNPQEVTKVLQLLQSLDKDRNLDNGIYIDTYKIDYNKAGNLTDYSLKELWKDPIHRIIPAHEAWYHFEQSLKKNNIKQTVFRKSPAILKLEKELESASWHSDCISGKNSKGGYIIGYTFYLEKNLLTLEASRVFYANKNCSDNNAKDFSRASKEVDITQIQTVNGQKKIFADFDFDINGISQPTVQHTLLLKDNKLIDENNIFTKNKLVLTKQK
ncbi:hypothetical protein [Psychrobacter sp. I-STPA10]|uniref:hypothetical protein n=1 Tax=Psychrobacter sp. I-STPA10 TaxID=2585769 RepID=UPI001E3682E8|nr:hypothetical protein [Psychrobacter sp. I-STPA10]